MNDLSGNVSGNVVQAGNIHGGITFQVAPAPDPAVPPDQVPVPAVAFVNRTPELTALDTGLDRATTQGGRSRILFDVITGIPGIGKTTLACVWADRAHDRFPDGQIYVDYGALRDGEGADVSAAVAMGLRALGEDAERIPASLQERAALFRTRTAGRRILVVLDDVTQPAQVRPLLPKGHGSGVLVTSGSRLDELVMDGARLMPLEPLDRDSGLRLLSERCGADAVDAERPAAERLVELCAGHPKALQLAAARLLTGRRLTMAALAAELADESRRLSALALRGEHSVSAVLELSYRALPPDAARLYRILGWIPGGSFDTGTAAVAAGLGTAATEALVAVLEDASLLDLTDDGRHRFHSLVRLHARERAAAEDTPPGRPAVVERVTRHYLVLTALADHALRADRLRIADLSALLRDAPDPFAAPGGPDPLDWLDAERANILAVLREAAALGLDTQVWQLAEAFTALFLRLRYLGDWTESLELGAEAAARDMVPAAEARLRSLLSRPLTDLGAHDRAGAELDKAVACAETAGHLALSASVQEFHGRHLERTDPARAIAAYRRSAELNTQAGERRGVAIATFFLGGAQDAAGEHTEALETLRRAHRDLLAVEDARMAARALAAIGTVHDHLGDADEALRVLADAVRDLEHSKAGGHYLARTLV
ncbi:tetratricopeptide repeat protein, partial [Streptomyces sp. TRM64462]|uniref:tetratricopeptide repeat protein n=1 Tax=Streptomyces sp. TRM64462 TaxID=2741726 RepID=UPI001585DA09